MSIEHSDNAAASVLGAVGATREALSVRRVFGDPYELDGVTIVPVARVAGGAGGGGGEGTGDSDAGSGFGTGFGLVAQPVGVYKIHDGEVVWLPAVDVTQLVRGGQVLAGIVAVCITLVALRRSRAARA
jgi:uncharacterized spore protein YtfJ